MGNSKTVSSSSQNAHTSLSIDKSENPNNPTTEVIARKPSVETKKILAEKNGSHEVNLRNSPTNSDRFGENVENSTTAGGFGFRPYDPLTNYLSPRPKFLRYKPDRRREVLLRIGNEIKGDGDGVSRSGRTNSIDSLESSKGLDDTVVSSCVSVSSSSIEANEKIVIVEEVEGSSDESEEDYEDVHEGCCNLRGVLKFMLLLVVLVTSTSYISSMNSPKPASPMFRAISNIKDGSYVIRDHVEGLVKSFNNGSHGTSVEEITSPVEINSELIGGVHSEELEVPDMCEGDFIETEQSKTMEILDYEEEKKAVNELVPVMEHENDETLGVRDYEDKKEIEELVHEMELPNEQKLGAPDYEEDKKAVDGLVRAIELENEESVGAQDATEEDNGIVIERSEEEIHNYDSEIEDGGGSIGIKQLEQETIAANKDETIFKANAKVVSALFSVIGSLIVTALHFKWRRIGRNDNSPPGIEPCIESSLILTNEEGEQRQWREENQSDYSPPVVEPFTDGFAPKRSSSVPTNEEGQYKQQLEDLSNSRTLIEPHEEEPKAISQSSAPSVELLGEFVVGEVSSSLRSNGMKSRTVTSEVNSHSISAENRIISESTPPPVEVGSQPTLSAVSAKNSSSLSYQNKTANKKKGKKRDQSANKDVETPIRRSSRIRNRTVTSP